MALRGLLAGRVLHVLPVWIAARIVVLATLALAHAHRLDGPAATTPGPRHGSIRACWHGTGGGTRRSAGHGYVASGLQSVRFFPAFPMAARAARSGARGSGWAPPW